MVATLLREDGWKVYTPSLSGVGDRAHLASPQIGIETAIRDITALVEYRDLDDIVLCGHSAGAVPVTGAADRIPERIRHLLYLDGPAPTTGSPCTT